jgi:hypothetical protein
MIGNMKNARFEHATRKERRRAEASTYELENTNIAHLTNPWVRTSRVVSILVT